MRFRRKVSEIEAEQFDYNKTFPEGVFLDENNLDYVLGVKRLENWRFKVL